MAGVSPKLMVKLLTSPEIEDEQGQALSLGVRDRTWLGLVSYMALCVDELHAINVGNISQDGEHTIIRIKGKGSAIRKGVVPPLAATPLRAWIELAGIENDRSGALFRPGKSAVGRGRDGF